MNRDNKIYFLVLCILAFAGCTKQKVGPLTDMRPLVPVTVQNASDYRPEPTVTTSLSGSGSIQIILSIPVESKRTIKEITKVAASTSYTKITSGTSGFYNTSSIAVNSTIATFSTSLTEYFTKNPVSSNNPAAKANTELALRFYFLVTLDDGSSIVTEPVRVLVLN